MWEHAMYRNQHPNPLKAELNAKLLKAVAEDKAADVQSALDAGADVNARNAEDNRTALMTTASSGNAEMMRILLSRGAALHEKDRFGNFAIHMAAEQGHLACIKLLMDKRSLANVGNLNYRTPLMVAAANGHADAVEYLILRGVSMTYQVNKRLESELTVASRAGHLDVVRVLLKHAKPGVDRGVELNHALRAAVYWGRAEIVRVLLRAGADVGYTAEGSLPLLFLAIKNEDLETVECLVECGADIDQRDPCGYTPLKVAFMIGTSDIVTYLESKGARWKSSSESLLSMDD